jgi:hypothetical protein
MSAQVDDICRMAINLARNCGYAVFPCGDDKRPTRPSEAGVLHGFHDASIDPEQIAWLWGKWPGSLIGVATGARSGVSVLDVDPEHPDAFVWWEDACTLLPMTRTYRTRRGGLHLWMLHRYGVTNSQGKIARGIDTRGEGGYAIFWFATGLECVDHTPPQPWPAWLLDELHPPRPPPRPAMRPVNPDRAVAGVLRRLASAQEGERNGVLFWAANRLRDHGISQREAETLLLPIASDIGLTDHEARRTIVSAQGRTAA